MTPKYKNSNGEAARPVPFRVPDLSGTIHDRSDIMACYHPLKGYEVGITINNKTKYHITSYETDMYNLDGTKKEYIEIPCGRCIGCRLAYSRMWADRCLAEATLHDSSYFVTLTYNDDNLPDAVHPETGEIGQYKTLHKRDMQLFMKRLRKNYKHDNKIRFFLAGEYGSQTARPHYHALLFGLKLDDLQLYKKTPLGFKLYTSEFLNEVWQYKGYVIIAEVTWETCAYTARYIMKKQKGVGKDWFVENGIQQEFTLMSRKPGIAKEFYNKNKLDLLRYGEVNISTPKGGRKIRNTKYFDKFLEIEYPGESKENKDRIKKQMEVIKQKKLEQTSLSYLDMLEVAEEIKQERIKKLPRKEI